MRGTSLMSSSSSQQTTRGGFGRFTRAHFFVQEEKEGKKNTRLKKKRYGTKRENSWL
jgi:hypothetical protein